MNAILEEDFEEIKELAKFARDLQFNFIATSF